MKMFFYIVVDKESKRIQDKMIKFPEGRLKDIRMSWIIDERCPHLAFPSKADMENAKKYYHKTNENIVFKVYTTNSSKYTYYSEWGGKVSLPPIEIIQNKNKNE